MALKVDPVARVEMLIRRPVSDVYQAFVDPAVTTRFWFTRGSDVLKAGSAVKWYWDMYGVSADVAVKVLEPNKRIVIEWPTPVEWVFTERTRDTTFVVITASGFTGDDDEKVAQALDSKGGFTFAIAACKAYLEHGVHLNVVGDHAPDAHVKTAQK